MSLRELFASIRERRHRSAQQSTDEKGAQITRRLQELFAVPTPTQVETPSTNTGSENDPTCYCEGRPHWLWSQQGSHVGYAASDKREV
jgi:hypothetical protein